MSVKTPEEEAEAQIREIIAEADLQDDHLDAFVERLPRMRTSALFGYIIDPAVLADALGLAKERDIERGQLVGAAAVIALKDEIDRRFPVPDAKADPDLGRGDEKRGIACGGKHPPPACDDPRCWVANPWCWKPLVSGHAPIATEGLTAIVGCTCGWRTPPGTSDSDDAFAWHVAEIRAAGGSP